jgi:hypothetical protein
MGLSWIIMDFHGDKPIKMGLKWDMGMWEFHGAITNYDSSGDAGYPCYNMMMYLQCMKKISHG